MTRSKSYLCHCCGKLHDGLPMSYGSDAPDQWFGIPEGARRTRAQLSSDQCIIDNENYYLKGNIELPVHGESGKFIWTVWVSLSRDNFNRASEMWNKKDRVSEPSYIGWLSTSLPPYPETTNLKAAVISRKKGVRFLIELETTDHPLSIEQKSGISWERIQDFAEKILHQ
jgi:hypothetical protein